jgi:nucleoside-diphosphate-sugar epimerase
VSPKPEYCNLRALVTGAGGFIISHLVEALVGAGAHVKALVRYISRGSWGLIWSGLRPRFVTRWMLFSGMCAMRNS